MKYMMKSIVTFLLFVVLAGCSPSVYQVYEKYSDDPDFEKMQVDNEVFKLANLFIPSKEKAAKRLLESIVSAEIINYSGDKKSTFQKEVLSSLKSNGYKEISEEKGVTLFAKRRLGNVKEFHALRYDNKGKITVFSVKGNFSVLDIAKVYKLIKKQEKIKGFF